ncbi:MAG: glycine C-acetyltransferase [Limnochordia bacterium]|nr:glycine C-acetyltransferase [Limnochordia bacterium]MDD2630125.1 glycine C-acetyltransferase [Limnochordia bacterium]
MSLSFLQEHLTALQDSKLYNRIKVIEGAQGAWVEIDGRRMLNLCSNNYLGLANHPALREAAQRAIEEFGVGPGAVRSIAGTNSLHQRLEEQLAHFKKTEAVLSFQSGFNANLAVIPALVGKEDVIISDALNHASIIDGCRLSRATVYVYPHRDMAALEKLLGENQGRKVLVITDGVFSMDGDIAPLPEIARLAKQYGAITMVDDAHGEGVLGSHGRGIVDHFGLHGQIDVEVGTLSKAFGVVGGFVAGSKLLIDYLKQRARPFLFSSALTSADVAACQKAVEILDASDELVSRLWDNARYFQQQIQEAGFTLGQTETPITPVMLGESALAQALSEQLFAQEAVFAQAIVYPTVPQGKARIRVMVSAAHSQEDLDYGIAAFKRAGTQLGLI